ncbi:MAG: hypothetical protein KatS3mg009_0401 [Acidimicrobiia bacterium]|jgi:hypothetical protein|nr:MAG: hypothetical protein KatS3mg009_0401 [Acidimicrobiia bacterium]
MDAKVGDEIVVDSPHTGGVPRRGEVVEVILRGDVVQYRVRWSDGRETVFSPGSDAHVVPARTRG